MINLVRSAINKRPRLSALHQTAESLEIVFVCEGSVPAALQEEYPLVHRVLRSSQPKGGKAWTKILRKAYRGKESNKGKSIRRGLHQYVHELLERALLIVLESAQGTEESYPGIDEEIRQLREIATGKRGHPKSTRRQERDAIRFAQRYQKLKPEVTKLHKFVHDHGSSDDHLVGRAAEKALKYEWLDVVTRGNALGHLPTNGSGTAKSESRLTGKWQPWQLAVGVMHEQQGDQKRFESNTILKYVSLGKSHLKKKKTPNKAAA